MPIKILVKWMKKIKQGINVQRTFFLYFQKFTNLKYLSRLSKFFKLIF
jgi:hypothetical protein